jgi:hypothetical protein
MTKCFRPWRVNEAWLLPPAVQEFVPEGHAAHLVRDIVAEELDLSAILSAYTEPRGYPPYHPAMMVALLLYAYSRVRRRSWLMAPHLPADEREAIERHLREYDRLSDDLRVVDRELARDALADATPSGLFRSNRSNTCISLSNSSDQNIGQARSASALMPDRHVIFVADRPSVDLTVNVLRPDLSRAPAIDPVAFRFRIDDVDLYFLVSANPTNEAALVHGEGDALHESILSAAGLRVKPIGVRWLDHPMDQFEAGTGVGTPRSHSWEEMTSSRP